MSRNEIYNKVKLKMKVISFACFPPKNENFNILPFIINNTPIIKILNNKKVVQNLDNLDMLHLNDGIFLVTTLFDVFFYG